MWIFSVDDSRGNITKHCKKIDAPPPVTTQQIQFENPPSLLDLSNRHSLVIFQLVCSVLTFDSYNYFDLLFSRPTF